MSEDSSQERTEEPTEKRLREAREKGQVARSRELNTVTMLLAATLSVYMFGDQIGTDIKNIMRTEFRIDRASIFDDAAPIAHLANSLLAAVKLLMPLFIVMVLASVVGPALMGGVSFSLSGVAPKMSKLNPLKGLVRMFGLQGLMELLKSMAKFILLGIAATALFYAFRERYVQLGQQALETGVSSAVEMMAFVFAILSVTLSVVAFIDVPYQKWEHIRKQRMTKQETKEESRENNGSPEVKAKIRRLQQEAANRKMLVDVKTTDVIVVNPTHYSVALKYEQGTSAAPTVVAKGVDHMALRIREVGRAHDVEIFSSPLLARVLYHQVKLRDEVPFELYVAVAQVLAYVFQLRQYRAGQASQPQRPRHIPIPHKFQEGRRGQPDVAANTAGT